MNNIKTLFIFVIITFIGCNSDEPAIEIPIVNEPDVIIETTSKVLMLQVNYNDQVFEGGKEFIFNEPSNSFSITALHPVDNFDFHEFELRFTELDERLFYGSVVWAGSGGMSFPTSIEQPGQFPPSNPNTIAIPANGFENVLDMSGITTGYEQAWSAVENLAIVNEYFITNPDQTIKIFLYTPSQGMGNPEEWKWIIYIKK